MGFNFQTPEKELGGAPLIDTCLEDATCEMYQNPFGSWNSNAGATCIQGDETRHTRARPIQSASVQGILPTVCPEVP